MHNFLQFCITTNSFLINLIRMKLRISVVSSPCHSPQEDGAGKSSLCQQFLYGRQVRVRKRWTDIEWESSLINKNHFFYWGSSPLHLPDGTDLTIRIVEQTVIWHCESDTPHGPSCNASYAKQVTQTSLPSPGKSRIHPEQVSMYSHVGKGLLKSDESTEEEKSYPSWEFSNEGINGFLCMVDPTLVEGCVLRQQNFLKTFVQLAKQANRKVVFLLSKCDLASAKQLVEARHFIRNKLKKQSPIIEVSTFDIYNIKEAFIVIAQRCLRVKPVSQVLTWEQHRKANQLLLSRQIGEFREYLLRIVGDSSWTWDEFLQQLKSSSQSFLATNVQHGELKRIFCLHILELKLKEAGGRYGLTPADKTYGRLTSSQAVESAKSYQEYLHESIKTHPDLTPSYPRGDYSHYASVDTQVDKHSILVSPPPLPFRKDFGENSLSPVLNKGLSKFFSSRKIRKTKSWSEKIQMAVDRSPCLSKDDIAFFPPPDNSENDFSLLNSMLSNTHSREDIIDLPDNKDDTFRRRAKTTSSGKYLHRPLPPSPSPIRTDKKTQFPGVFNPRHSRSRSDQLSLTLSANPSGNNQSFPDLSRTSVYLGEPAPYLDPIELNRFTMPRFRDSRRYSETEGDVFTDINSPKRLIKREHSFPMNDFHKRHSFDPLMSPPIYRSKRDASVQTYQRGQRRREQRWETPTSQASVSQISTRISTSKSCTCIPENMNEQDSGTASFSYSPTLPPDNSHLCGRISQGVMYDIVEP